MKKGTKLAKIGRLCEFRPLFRSLMRTGEFHRGYSDRVLHMLLLLAAVQPNEKPDGQSPDEAARTD
jgi:hypothetical protein